MHSFGWRHGMHGTLARHTVCGCTKSFDVVSSNQRTLPAHAPIRAFILHLNPFPVGRSHIFSPLPYVQGPSLSIWGHLCPLPLTHFSAPPSYVCRA